MITAPTLNSADVAEHYDQLDEYYRRLWGDHLHHGLWLSGRESIEIAVEQLIDAVAKPLCLSSGDRICDIGCGYGGTSRYLVSRNDVDVTGVTISAVQHQYATAKTHGLANPRFLLQNWETNTLATAAFDAAVAIECVSHVENKTLFFEQIHRVLRPGKRASITAWLTCERPQGWQQRHLLQPICDEGRLPSMGSASEYRKLIASVGLNLIKFEDLSKFVRRTWRVSAGRVLVELMKSQKARRFLCQANQAVFAWTVMRILVAYHSGSMRYGHFVVEKPVCGPSRSIREVRVSGDV